MTDNPTARERTGEVARESARLIPPPEHQHFEFHWLKHRLSGDFIAINWKSSGWWNSDPIGSGAATPEQMYSWGWRYHGPCDPSAITLNPDDPAQIEAIARQRATTEGHDPDIEIHVGTGPAAKAWIYYVDDVQDVVRAAIVALKEMKR